MTEPRFERVIGAIGNLARPAAIYMVGYASAVAIHEVSKKVENGNDGAIFLGAVAVLLLGVIGARAIENINAARQDAKVATAKVTAAAGGDVQQVQVVNGEGDAVPTRDATL